MTVDMTVHMHGIVLRKVVTCYILSLFSIHSDCTDDMMIPKTKKLFISYRSSDHRDVDHIAEQLRSRVHDDATPKYTTWQDKHDLTGAKSWWDGIVDAIIDCDVFVFHLSEDYMDSRVCLAELNYAIERNLPIVPVVLDTAYYIDPRTNKPDIKFWSEIPEWLGKYQFIFYNDDDFLYRFDRAIAEFEKNWSRQIDVRRPLNPDSDSVHGTSYEVYASAIDYAGRLAFDDAKPLFRELLTRNDTDFADICRQWLELLDRYQDLLNAKAHRAPRAVFKRKWQAYIAYFPLDFVDDLYPDSDTETIIFDPKNLAKQPFWRRKKVQAPPKPVVEEDLQAIVAEEQATAQAPKTTEAVRVESSPPPAKIEVPEVITTSKPTSLDLMPEPFEWISIAGKEYEIAKYPVTNAQFAKFIEAGGYNTQKWWTEAGWNQKQSDNWTEPRYWQNSKFNGDLRPVVGVSWYESVAFCLWLSAVTGEKIMLPTEEQWQYAAQGDDGREYPWGNDWNPSYCNNNVRKEVVVSEGILGFGKKTEKLAPTGVPDGHGTRTTPVTAYESLNKSACGAIDMAGNVWELCLTDYEEKTNDINSNANRRVLRGGSWYNNYTFNFRVSFRDGNIPNNRNYFGGFRVVRL